jgi:xanthosine utilization system XapX-like protein
VFVSLNVFQNRFGEPFLGLVGLLGLRLGEGVKGKNKKVIFGARGGARERE